MGTRRDNQRPDHIYISMDLKEAIERSGEVFDNLPKQYEKPKEPYIFAPRLNWLCPMISPPIMPVATVNIDENEFLPPTAWYITDKDGEVVAASDGTEKATDSPEKGLS